MNAAELFVRALEKEGVTHMFGVPGEENLHVLEAVRNSTITFIPTRHEQSAGFMAATFGRLTGKAGVALSTLGPGATNFVTAAAYAELGAMPMLMVTGQKPIKKSKQGAFQIVNVVELMRPITKFAKQIVSADAIAASVREAFRRAEEERPGAVLLEIPEDVAAEPAEGSPFEPKKTRRAVAEEKAIREAVRMMKEAKRPLILVGAGANRKLTAKMLRVLIDKTGIPFFNTQMGKGVIDERHPQFLGTAALSSGDFIHKAVAKADLIVNVGHDVVEKPPFIMREGSGQKVIHVNFTSAQVDAIYFPEHEVVGDIANAIWQISEALGREAHWDFSEFYEIAKALKAHAGELSGDESFPLKPQRIVADVRKVMPEDGILCLDNGMYKLWFARQYEAYAPNTLLLDNALATMGAGLSSAIAAALVNPGKRVIALAGDGGFLMNSQEMETAVRLKINLTVLLLNDNGYGMIKWKQDGMNLPSFGLNFGNPDFVKYAEAYGAKGHRVTKASELVELLEETGKNPGVHLLEVPIDYSENDRVFTKELKRLMA